MRARYLNKHGLKNCIIIINMTYISGKVEQHDSQQRRIYAVEMSYLSM